MHRIRRIKCDEAKPACLKCTQTGRKCDGYSTASPRNSNLSRTVSKKKPVTAPKILPQHPLETSSFYSLPFKIPGSQTDRQLFHYFCVNGAKDLAGFSCGSWDFWNQLVLECSHHEPVVRTALIALASIHRTFVAEDAPAVELTNPLEEYNKAIRRLRRHINSEKVPSKKVILVCCALFYCFDSVRGEHQWALNHLQGALNLLQRSVDTRNAGNSSSDDLSVDELNTITKLFSRLDVQASVFDGDGRLPSLLLVSKDEKSGLTNCIPSDFARFTEAEAVLSKLENWIMHFIVSDDAYKGNTEVQLPSDVAQEIRALKSQIYKWGEAFDRLLIRQRPYLDKGEDLTCQNSISMMKVQQSCFAIALLEFCPVSDLDTDTMKLGYQASLEEIESVLRRQSIDTSAGARSFSCDSILVMSLFFIACKAHDAQNRERALSLLGDLTRREGVWDARMMAGIARGILELELDGKKFPTDEEGVTVNEWGVKLAPECEPGFHNLAKVLNVPVLDVEMGHQILDQ